MSADDVTKPFRDAGVPLANQSAIRAALDKRELNGENKWWLVPKGQEEDLDYRASILGLLLENQEKWFDEMEVQGQIPNNIVELFGENWRKDIYTALLKAWRTTPLVNICSIQPFTGPLSKVAYLRHRAATTKPGSIPEVRLDIALKEVQAESRKSKVRFTSPTVLDRMVDSTTLLGMAFEEQLTETTREVLGTLLNAATVDEVEAGSDLLAALRRTSNVIFRKTQRGPANNIVAGSKMLAKLGVNHDISNGRVQKVGTLEGKWNVYLDPLFPENQLLAWYQGPSILDTGIIYSPYHYGFDRMDTEGTTYAGRVRHKITVVRPEVAALIEVES